MADESIPQPQTQPDQPQEDRRNLWGLLGIVAVVVVLVLLFLMMRGCSPAQNASSTGNSSTKEIVPVTGLHPLPGQVSVWVEQGTTVDTILTAAGLNGSGVTDMGGGRFVIGVPAGTEAVAVAKLKAIGSVHDAGLVYSDQSAAPPASPIGSAAASGTSY